MEFHVGGTIKIKIRLQFATAHVLPLYLWALIYQPISSIFLLSNPNTYYFILQKVITVTNRSSHEKGRRLMFSYHTIPCCLFLYHFLVWFWLSYCFRTLFSQYYFLLNIYIGMQHAYRLIV